MKLKVGLIGLGDQWDNHHGPALRALSDRYEVAAICCEVATKAEAVASEYNCVSVDGFRALLERSDIDAVLALSPDWVGPLPILAACEAGKAVYAGGAFDMAPEQLDEISRRIRDSGVAFMAELPKRFAPATIRLKELIATRLGQPRLIFCHQRSSVEEQTDRLRRGHYNPISWRNLMEAVDWICYLANLKPRSVNSARYQQPVTGSSALPLYYQTVNLEFEGAINDEGTEPPNPEPAMAQLSVGHYIPQAWADAISYRRPAGVQICCEHGTAFVDLPSNLIWFDEAGQHTESLESDLPVGQQLLINFHRSVTSLVRNTADLENAYQAMNIVLACEKSIREKRRIDLQSGNRLD